MSDKRNRYFTVVFDGILAASPERIKEVVDRWHYKEYHEASVHIESPEKSGTVILLFIQLRLNDDRDQLGKPHQRAGIVNINGDALGSHVEVSFFDWESADDYLDAYAMARIHNYATIPNQQKIFEQLVRTLCRDVPVLQDNLKAMKNENMEEGATPKVENVKHKGYRLTDEKHKVKNLLDEACEIWAGRKRKGYVPKHLSNMEEFLDWLGNNDNISYISKDQFKKALKDAGERGIIKKEGRYWTLP